MPWLGKCDFCGRANEDPPRSGFVVSSHYDRDYVSCGLGVCSSRHADAKIREDISTDRIAHYALRGPTRRIRVQRSDGQVSVAAVKQCHGPRTPLRVRGGVDVELYLEFRGERERETLSKRVWFSDLARLNTHLPLVHIVAPPRATASGMDQLRAYQREMDSYCVTRNPATRLVLVSFIKEDGFFATFPREMVSLVLSKYYG
jgi:hypothetical protein